MSRGKHPNTSRGRVTKNTPTHSQETKILQACVPESSKREDHIFPTMKKMTKSSGEKAATKFPYRC